LVPREMHRELPIQRASAISDQQCQTTSEKKTKCKCTQQGSILNEHLTSHILVEHSRKEKRSLQAAPSWG